MEDINLQFAEMCILLKSLAYFLINNYFWQNCQDFSGKAMKEMFGQYIRQLRNGNGYNLTKLAAMLDIDSGTLSKIETGKKVFDDKLLPKLAKVFGLDLKKLKDEYYSESIARLMCEKHYSDSLLSLAEEKVKYIRSKKTKQAKLNFEQ